jgi:hypothetical protein
MSKCFLVILENMQAVMQLVELARRVLIIALYCSDPNSPRAALKDGQYK